MQYSWTAPSFSRSSITGARLETNLLLRFQHLSTRLVPLHYDRKGRNSVGFKGVWCPNFQPKKTPLHHEGQSGLSQPFETHVMETDLHLVCAFDYGFKDAETHGGIATVK